MSTVRAGVASLLLIAATAASPAGCRIELPGREADYATPLVPAAADTAWRWVYVPEARQCTRGAGVAADSSGAYVVGGFSRGFAGDCPDARWGADALELRGETGFFLARHESDGSVRWTRRYGDGGRVHASGIARAADGSLYVAGSIRPAIFSPDPGRWDTGAGTLVATRDLAFLARLDSTGAVRWAREIEGVADVGPVAVDAGGRVYVAGSTSPLVRTGADGGPVIDDSADAYVAAYGADGERLWLRTAARGGHAAVTGVAATGYGICVTGVFDAPDVLTYAGEVRAFGVGHGFAAGYGRAGERL